jgi:two-component system, NtrC family, response regulator AtoC
MITNGHINILLVEDEDFDVKRIKNTINYYETKIKVLDTVSNGRAALELISNNHDKYDVVILDYQISGGLRGEELITKIKEINPIIQIIVITKMTINITDYNFANNLIKSGAYWYGTKYPGNIEEYIYQPTDFILSIFNAYERKKLEIHNLKSDKKLKQNVANLLEIKKIIGNSKPVTQLKENIERYAKSDVNILINGPSGTGKELVAWNIHLTSKRKYENFVPINCGSIPADLIESELFGYEKGAFTGANTGKAGLFEIAHNGTLFLDEVGELPLAA